MVGENQETAMTEIALAMAMGFFSLMILAIVSVGIPKETNKASSTTAVIAKFTTLQSKNNSPIGKKVTKKDIFIVYDGKAFLNKNLETINPENIKPDKRIILGLEPDFSVQRALLVQSKLRGMNVVLVALNDQWRTALDRKKKANANVR